MPCIVHRYKASGNEPPEPPCGQAAIGQSLTGELLVCDLVSGPAGDKGDQIYHRQILVVGLLVPT